MGTEGNYHQIAGRPQVVAPDVTLTGQAFGDCVANCERLCNVSVPPVSTTFTVLGGGCYEPPHPAGNGTMTWNDLTSVTMEYGDGVVQSAASLFRLSSIALGGTWLWAANATNMLIGQSRLSQNTLMGVRVKLTLLAGSPPVQTITFDGGQNVRMRPGLGGTNPPLRFRLDFITP